MSLLRTLLLTLLVTLGLVTTAGCQFLAGAAVGAGATEVAEEVDDDD